MKVLQINSVCSGSTGRIAAGISRVLKDAGNECLILYGRGAPATGVDCERIEGKAAFYLHTLYARMTDRQGFASTYQTKRMIRRIEAYRPDVIHIHNLHGYYLDWRILFKYLRSSGIPVIWTLHDCQAFTGHCAFFDAAGCGKWRSGCGACPQKTAYPASWLFDQSARNYTEKLTLTQGVKNLTFVTPSHWLEKLTKQSFLRSHPAKTIYNGIDLAVFRPTENDIRARYHIGEKPIYLGVANVWEPRKGLQTFYDLAERAGESAQIVLIGLSKKQLKNLPKGFIGLSRTESVQELAAWYTAADVFVNPTIEDNFPTTQLEALACGTPVVCYNTGGCAESLDDSCGIVVPKNDFSALADAVSRAKELKSEHCRRRAEQFGQQERFEEYLSLYHQVCAEESL